MKVKDLKKLLEGVDDEMLVLIPMNQHFDGAFYSPCMADSGVHPLGDDVDITEEEIQEMELLNKPLPETDHFILLPCGFDELNDESHKHLLN